jgi:cell division protein FtsB
MTAGARSPSLKQKARKGLSTLLAIVAALGLAAYALFGPSGLIALGDHKAALVERQAELERLEAEHAALENRVRLLDPENIDPDLGGELIRKELGVAAPDEYVIPLD